MFSAALASGQLGPLMCQFGLPAEAVEAANKGGEYLLPRPPLGTALLWWLKEQTSPFAEHTAGCAQGLGSALPAGAWEGHLTLSNAF